jgi:hypothetical protein
LTDDRFLHLCARANINYSEDKTWVAPRILKSFRINLYDKEKCFCIPKDMNSSFPNYALLTDAPPLNEDGHGCHVLSWNWITAVGSQLKLVVSHRMNPALSEEKMSKALPVPSFFYPDLCRIRFPHRLSTIKSVLEIIQFRFHLLPVCRCIKHNNVERIFALFGGNGWFLYIADWIARRSGLPMDIFLVDDIEQSARLHGHPVAARFFRWLEPQVLKRADRIFTISPGFHEHLCEKYGINAKWLPLPIPFNEVKYVPFHPQTPDVRYVSFLGGINQLYLSALRNLLHEISRWNETANIFKLRLGIMTYTDPRLVESELGKSENMEILYGRSDAECHHRLIRSWAIFLPYTFKEEHRLMVSTSFPSKLAESLAAGRPLLVYGPAYASLPRYFLENSLPLCITSPSQLMFGLHQIEREDAMSLTEKYQRVLNKFHSPAALCCALRIPAGK